MNKDFEFAFKESSKVLEKMKEERGRNNSHAYRLLNKSLHEYLRPLFELPAIHQRDISPFYNFVDELSGELELLKEVIEDSLNDKKYKEHHDWLISYQHLLNEYKKIKNSFYSSKRPKIFQKDKNSNETELQ